jgi:carboxypeptidase Q
MMRQRLAAIALLCSLLLTSLPAAAQQAVQTTPPRPAAADPNDPVERIKDEGMNRSQVMQTLMYLTDVIGPRLTNSPQMKRANEWTRDQLTKWGLQNAHLHAWGPFGRGWSLKRFSAEVVEPQAFPVIAYPKAWSPSTNGMVTAEVVYVDAKNEAELEKFKGQLAGKIVMTTPVREVKALFEAPGSRLTEKELLELANAPDPASVPPRQRNNFNATPEQIQQIVFSVKKANFVINEGAAIVVDPGRGDGGTVFVQGASVPTPIPADLDLTNPQSLMSLFFRRGGPTAYSKDAPKIPPQVVMAAEHYNRIVRMIQAGEKVKLALNIEAQFHDQDLMGYNTIAEIPGTDPALKDEIVMLGGHMDSWHGGTGATDNGAGVAVTMEAVRIIQALGLKPRRTIRIGLWSGEEQGLLGSRAYVKEHFGEVTGGQQGIPGMPAAGAQGQLAKKPAYDKFSVYFNLDNGTGKVRGVYMQGNSAAWPIFSRWLRPFNQTGATTLSMSNTGGTDHLAFDAIGLPGFQFIQDEIEYDTRTHHSNMDTFDRIQADDMKQAATVMAAFVYQAATMDQKFPRKPAPGATREVSNR